ncbi:MAG: hypothetical protein ACI85F_000011 [Bacteroidia bacterium]|jgi:hypothetical protein
MMAKMVNEIIAIRPIMLSCLAAIVFMSLSFGYTVPKTKTVPKVD